MTEQAQKGSQKLLAEYLVHNDHTNEVRTNIKDLEQIARDLAPQARTLSAMVETGRANPDLTEQVEALERVRESLEYTLYADREYLKEQEHEGHILAEQFNRAVEGERR